MRKFYSLVLIATALLIGTNAWAGEFYGSTRAELQAAVNAVIDGEVSDPIIKLTKPVNLNGYIWVGTQSMNAPYRSVTIDLNGYNITLNGNGEDYARIFYLTHGELNIINTAEQEANVQFTGTIKHHSDIIMVHGSYKSSRWNDDGTGLSADSINTRDQGWFSHLYVGKNVNIYAAEGCCGAGITCDSRYSSTKLSRDGGATEVNLDYGTNLGVGNSNEYGLAQGVRIDLEGKIEIVGTSTGKAYGIKANGYLQSPLSCATNNINKRDNYATNYADYNLPIDDAPADENGIKITHRLDTLDVPFIWVHPGAEIKVREEGDRVTALYAAGYAKWLVQGYCEGKTGMYVSSGVLDLNDAYIRSNADSWTQPTEAGSANGGGSGAVLNSRDGGYAGDIEFTVAGDTKIESVAGYAIEEIVNTTSVPNPKADPESPEYVPGSPETIQVTQISDITIEGGTIIGGDKGAIVISESTTQAAIEAAAADPEDDDKKVTVTVYGGTVDGNTQVGSTGDLDDLIPYTTNYHTTEVTVTDPKTGNEKTIIVVSQGAEPAIANPEHPEMPTTWEFIAEHQGANNSYQWTAQETNQQITSGTIKLNELQINSGTAGHLQELIIKNNAALEVNRLIMNDYARIIVEAGGKLIVKGTQGITSPSVNNITLESSESAQAIFLFHPEVQSNRHPNATVKLTSKGYIKGGDNTKKVWQRFGVPAYTSKVEEGAVIRYSTNPEDNPVTYNDASWIAAYDYNSDNWVTMPDEDAFVPFQCYEASSVATEANHTIYTFKCPLMGNSDFTLPLNEYTEWNYYANSYMAPIDIKQMLTSFVTNHAKVKGTVYVYRSEDNWWDNINLGQLGYFPTAAQTQIDPMQAFIFQKNAEGTADAVINYKKHIYNPDPTTTPVAAPVRDREVFSAAIVEIATADGAKDKLYLIESDKFTADFDNGYDAAKYMNNESFNIFAGEQLGIIATDNLEGTAISMTSKAQTSFTMTFSNVTNMEYAIRDNLTGTETAIEEGATYMFSTAANANIEGRFEIVPVAKMPTAIENVEATAAAKGIYPVSGQFVGNDYHSLPNGIYVVDGKKIVK